MSRTVNIGALIWIIMLPFAANGAPSYIADNLSQPTVQEAVTACLEDTACDTVYLPAGDSGPWQDPVDVNGAITIMGDGQDRTIINIDPSNTKSGAAFNCQADGRFIRISGMRINSTHRSGSKPSVISLKYRR